MRLREKAHYLLLKATSPQSVDFGHAAIYKFDRHCRVCGKGLPHLPGPVKRDVKTALKQRYCSLECQLKVIRGKRVGKCGETRSYRVNHMHVIEHAALASLVLARSEKRLNPLQRLVLEVHQQAWKLTAKLSWLSLKTGEEFPLSRYYRIIESIENVL